MKRSWIIRSMQAVLTLAVLFSALLSAGQASAAAPTVGAVFVENNAASGNAVIAFSRAADGSLTPAGTYATGGLGTGSGLGSQGALTLSPNNRWLFAVNAGSNDISVFAIERGTLRLTDRVSSSGIQPISVTFHDDLLYVVNASSANIAGFRFDDGHLQAVNGSIQQLSTPGAGPAEILFSPNGEVLAVTEKATNTIDIFTVGEHGRAQLATRIPSAGATPFGFDFDRRGRLFVSEAAGGAPGASSASAYAIREEGSAKLLSGAVANKQSAACWLVVNRNGRYAYVANTGSAAITTYQIGRDGNLSLLEPTGATVSTGVGSRPADLGVSRDSNFLYVRSSGTNTIGIIATNPDGSLNAQGTVTVPATAVGLASY